MNEDTKAAYRRCFGTPDGKKVLANLLMNLGYFDAKDRPVALQEFAARLLRTLGITDEPFKVEQLVDKMFEISQGE